jgi:hypothetical protein
MYTVKGEEMLIAMQYENMENMVNGRSPSKRTKLVTWFES